MKHEFWYAFANLNRSLFTCPITINNSKTDLILNCFCVFTSFSFPKEASYPHISFERKNNDV